MSFLKFVLQSEPEKQTQQTIPKPTVKKEEKKNDNQEREEPKCTVDKPTVRKVLRNFNEDIEYLEKLLKDKGSEASGNETKKGINDKVCDGLEYLYSRAEFWSQQDTVQLPISTWIKNRQTSSMPWNTAKAVLNTTDENWHERNPLHIPTGQPDREKQLENREKETHLKNQNNGSRLENTNKETHFDSTNLTSNNKESYFRITNKENRIENTTRDTSHITNTNKGSHIESTKRESRLGNTSKLSNLENTNKGTHLGNIHVNKETHLDNTSRDKSHITHANNETQKLTKQTRPKHVVTKEEKNDDNWDRADPKCPVEKQTLRKVLGRFNADIEYLEKMLKDKGSEASGNETKKRINDKVCDGLEYLYSRAEFWSQQETVQLPTSTWAKNRQAANMPWNTSKTLLNARDETWQEQSPVYIPSGQRDREQQRGHKKKATHLINTNKESSLENTNIESQFGSKNKESHLENTKKEAHRKTTKKENRIENTTKEESHNTSTNKQTHLENTDKNSKHNENTNEESHLENAKLANQDKHLESTNKETHIENTNKEKYLESMDNTVSAHLIKDLQQKLEEIDNGLADGNYQQSLEKAQETLSLVKAFSDEDIPDKPELLAQLHSKIGTAYLEMGKTDQAMEHHQKEMELATKHGLEDTKANTLDKLGKTYAKSGDYERAIEVWQDKIPLTKSALERAWLFHEMGWCAFELEKYSDARDYGACSLQAAEEADDSSWQLHASVLLAQSEAHLEDYKVAKQAFQKALKLAKGQDNTEAEQALQQALADIKKKLVNQQDNSDSEVDETDTLSIIDEVDEVPYDVRATTSSGLLAD